MLNYVQKGIKSKIVGKPSTDLDPLQLINNPIWGDTYYEGCWYDLHQVIFNNEYYVVGILHNREYYDECMDADDDDFIVSSFRDLEEMYECINPQSSWSPNELDSCITDYENTHNCTAKAIDLGNCIWKVEAR